MARTVEFHNIKKIEIPPLHTALILGVALLYFFIFFSSQYLPLSAFLSNNADALFIEDIARDLNDGGQLFNWRLTQAPYLFPDITLARALSIPLNIGRVGIYYQAIFGALNALLIHALCRQLRINSITPVSLSLTIYALSYVGGISGDAIAQYFGLIGHHSGIITSLLLATMAIDHHLRAERNNSLTLAALFLAIFLGTISDSLMVLALAPSLSLLALLLVIRDRKAMSRAATLMLILLTAIIAGKAFGYTNPFPQDREFMQAIVSYFPNWTLPAIKKFTGDLGTFVIASRASALILSLYLISMLVSLRYIWGTLNRTLPLDTRFFLCLFSLLAPLMTIAAQLTLGLYTTIDSSRQWAPLVFLAIVFSGTVLYSLLDRKRTLETAVMALIVLLLIFTTRGLYLNKGRTAPVNNYQSLIECMLENQLPAGSYYIADYWNARPIRLYSAGRFGVSPYVQLLPFTNASNIKNSRAATPRFIITGITIDYDTTIKKFGAPSREFCRAAGAGLGSVILDYSDNEEVRSYLLAKARNSY